MHVVACNVVKYKMDENVSNQFVSNTLSGTSSGFVQEVPDLDYINIQRAADYLWQIGIPFIIIHGTFGNVMIVLIQRRLSNSNHSTMSVYFITLALFDTLRLWFDPVFWWAHAIFGNNVLDSEKALCKIRVFVTYMTGQASAWILIAITFHRAATTLWPHRANVFCERRAATLVMSAVFGVFVLFNAHILYGHTTTSSANETLGTCFFTFVDSDYESFFQTTWGWIDTCISTLVPFSLLLVSNTVLLCTVRQSVRETRLRLATGPSLQQGVRRRTLSSMSVTLVSTSVAFFLFTAPVSVYMVFEKTFAHSAKENLNIMAAKKLVFSIGYLLWLENCSINFYIYCLTGRKYRTEFVNLFISCRKLKQKTKSKLQLSGMDVLNFEVGFASRQR